MSIEQTSRQLRARRHAALGDVTRLYIVDLLAVGDRSAGQVRAELGIPANLLTHHLNVLGQAGLIGENRSEGDGRRKYLHLTPEALEAGELPAPIRARRLLFVCTGNTARSPLAAALWQQLSPVPATSAGVVPAPRVSEDFLAVAAGHGLSLEQHRPRAIDEVTETGDLVVTLCDRAHEKLGLQTGLHWSVPNPSPAGTRQAYETAYAEIDRRVRVLLPHLQAA
ncbi:ArsR family transcriptional regulator [Kineosporia rhizophila]|uniref:arsenate reductase/protein-tyrosine-phosphatase family protein n=1 Tax=Kineosporia TaxID=49184 RepID=UPI001E3F8DBE|nr:MULTISPECIES: ArsR family transcriptional regulator [Kineosporia]MCE0536535.1 ArsR family transcriptional regulator [Kineosporia rhizophila]GLY15370.1 ArsR family transcriptional regulator [Kineosporia sp. NBRC 101677]